MSYTATQRDDPTTPIDETIDDPTFPDNANGYDLAGLVGVRLVLASALVRARAPGFFGAFASSAFSAPRLRPPPALRDVLFMFESARCRPR